jgi:adenylyl-sulfate kinase
MPARRRSATAWTIWFTGLSGSGKSTLARALSRQLKRLSIDHELIDGDEIRTDLCKDLGFSRSDRCENIRRIGYVAALLNRHKIVSIVAAIAPYREARDEVRKRIPCFLETHVDCALEILAQRDVKGLYRRALAREISDFTGVSDPYEPPLSPDIYLNSGAQSEADCTASISSKLRDLGWLPATRHLRTARNNVMEQRAGKLQSLRSWL